jgi:hypothetical protein
LLFIASTCIWYLSNVFRYAPFSCVSRISMVFCMDSNVCPFVMMCCANFDCDVLYLNALLCSLYLV